MALLSIWPRLLMPSRSSSDRYFALDSVSRSDVLRATLGFAGALWGDAEQLAYLSSLIPCRQIKECQYSWTCWEG